MGNAAEDGEPHRVSPPAPSACLAVDVERKDGSRSLVVPVLHGASEMDFTDFVSRYDELVVGARDNTLEAAAYRAPTSPDQSGRHRHRGERAALMPGRGTIVATGAIGYPPGLTALAPNGCRSWACRRS